MLRTISASAEGAFVRLFAEVTGGATVNVLSTVFARNRATRGGALLVDGASADLANCRFEETTSSNFQAHGFDFPKRPQILNSMKMAFMAAR